MPKRFSDEALVLRTYNVGEADRFCILLTQHHGRIALRGHGLRRLQSSRGPSVLPLNRIAVSWDERSVGGFISDAVVLESFADCSKHLPSFSCAQQGIELLLQLITDGPQVSIAESDNGLYPLCCDFLRACSRPHTAILFDAFVIKLFTELGTMPSLTLSCVNHRAMDSADALVFSVQRGGFCTFAEDPHGSRLPTDLYQLLLTLSRAELGSLPQADDTHARLLRQLVYCLAGSHVGSLKSPLVASRLSSGVTPTKNDSGRGS